MKKYCYFMNNSPFWLDLAIELKKQNLAEPNFWLGDDVHVKKATKIFGQENIFKAQNFIHNPHEFKNIEYISEYSDFFDSQNYLRAKDTCLKMMDRLDLYGTFSRIDREVFFHQITIKTLKHFFLNKPDFLLMGEAPHSHAQYLIYEICLFLKIPCFKFNRWTIAPLLFLQNMENEEIIEKERNLNAKIDKILELEILKFLNEVKSKNEEYEIFYMKEQRIDDKFLNRLIKFFRFGIKNIYKDIKHNLKNALLKRISPINPYKLNFFTRIMIKKKRAENLNKSYLKLIDSLINEKKFVYFSLHFEPERTTNPDGGRFHNQFLAIQKIRNLVPDSIDIIVKEHPSQFYIKDKGSLGKSPFFYNLIKNIKGVRFVETSTHPISLIKKSVFVVTITGTVALEASILGKKSVIFGSTPFPNVPNIFKWSENLSYDEIISKPIEDFEAIQKSLMNLKNKFSVAGCQNGSMMNYFKSYLTPEFANEEIEGTVSLVKTLLKKF
jgi:hypothetical protein